MCKLEPTVRSFLFDSVTALSVCPPFRYYCRAFSSFLFRFLFQKSVATSELVNGKNLKMFSFEGDFKTRPKVSLGGASKKVSVI